MFKPIDSSSNQHRLVRTFSGHSDPVNACAISPDGSFVVSGAGNVMKIYDQPTDHTLKVWDFESGEELLTLAGHEEAIKACAISRDGSLIISVGEDCTVVWDARTGENLNRLKPPGLACSACTEDSTIVIASFFVVLLDFQTGDERSSILTDDILHDCAISSDGSYIVTAGTDQHLVIWSAQDGEQIAALESWDDIDPSGDVKACAISPDGSFMVSGGSDGFLRIWDTESMSEMRVFKGHREDITACAISFDSCLLLSSSWDGTLKLWNPRTCEHLLTLEGHAGWVNGCVFSPCGKYVISAGDDMTVKVWDIADLR